MTSIPARCIERHSNPAFQIKEQLSEVTFENPELLEIHQIAVDGCVLGEGGGERCDWLINVLQKSAVRGNDRSLLVELKGSDIDKAVRQLVASQTKLADHINRHVTWIVCYSGSPRFNTAIANLVRNAKKDHRATLSVNDPWNYDTTHTH